MGSDDLFKKKKSRRTSQKIIDKQIASNTILIFTEGEKTEVNYFKSIKNLVKETSNVNIEIKGFGEATTKLVDTVKNEVEKYKYPVENKNVWIVFDKDSFLDFDIAIANAEKAGFNCAWSNESFELWYVLHFCYYSSNNHRSDYINKLDDELKQLFGKNEKYEKNSKDMFNILGEDRLQSAIQNSKGLESCYNKNAKPSDMAPCTKVHHLVEFLYTYIKSAK